MIKKRNLFFVGFMTVFTFGIYLLYWTYKTKEEINSHGGNIPTFLAFFIPFVNFYFMYCYAKSFVEVILKNKDDVPSIVIYTAGLICAYPLTMLFVQYELNKQTHA